MDTDPKSASENDLLETLRQRVGCTYLSDLHQPQWAAALTEAVGDLDEGDYSAHVWQRVAKYITGTDCDGASAAAEIKKQLLQKLEQQRGRLI